MSFWKPVKLEREMPVSAWRGREFDQDGVRRL